MSNETVTRDIAAEPARVWAAITDLENLPQVLSSVSRVEVLTDGPFRLGTTWRETHQGHDEAHEMKVAEVEALGLAKIESVSADARHITTYTLEALHPGTRVTLSYEGAGAPEAGTLKKLAAKVVGSIGTDKSLRSSMEQDLADIATAVEKR